MKAIVCVKQVPDTSGKVAVKADGTLDRASMATITNPDDLNALEETVAYVKERKQFGRPIAAFQNTQFELAEMKARVEAAKYLVYAAALKKQQAMDGAKVRYSVEAAQAKLIAARTASDVTRRCLQLFGGYGYTRDYPIERMMRDAKITEIYEGTSEVQMMVISGALLK